MTNLLRIWAVLLPLSALPCVADGAIYGFEDDQGTWHLSSDPIDPHYQLLTPPPASPAELPPAPLTAVTTGRYQTEIHAAALRYRLPEALLHAIVSVESGYRPQQQSRKGAVGLMQVLPATAARYGVSDPWPVTANLDAGSHYLKDLLTLFPDRLELAVAAYNAGEQAVVRYGNRIPPFPETQHYVSDVLRRYRELSPTFP